MWDILYPTEPPASTRIDGKGGRGRLARGTLGAIALHAAGVRGRCGSWRRRLSPTGAGAREIDAVEAAEGGRRADEGLGVHVEKKLGPAITGGTAGPTTDDGLTGARSPNLLRVRLAWLRRFPEQHRREPGPVGR
jgi:hypothetical protein